MFKVQLSLQIVHRTVIAERGEKVTKVVLHTSLVLHGRVTIITFDVRHKPCIDVAEETSDRGEQTAPRAGSGDVGFIVVFFPGMLLTCLQGKVSDLGS